MSLTDRIAEFFRKNGEHLTVATLPDEKAGDAIVANEAYFRIWLSDAFLARGRDWFKDNYPAVHATVTLNLQGREGASFTRLARPKEGQLGPGSWKNFALTSLMPYRGGVVELDAGLSALQGESALGAAFDALQDFSGLVGPPLGEALGVAQKVSNGIERLLTAGGDDVLLALHHGFDAPGGGGGSHAIAPGYLAILSSSEAPGDLAVANGSLYAGGQPVTGFDYMLFRIEGRRERDDWRLPRFEELRAKAVDASLKDDQSSYSAFKNALLAEVLNSPDLTVPDRARVATAFKKELDEATEIGKGAVAEDMPPLEDTIAKFAPSVEDFAGIGELTLDEFLAADGAA